MNAKQQQRSVLATLQDAKKGGAPLGPTFSKLCFSIALQCKATAALCSCSIARRKTRRRTANMPICMQQISLPGSDNEILEQVSCTRIPQRYTSNYRFSFCKCVTKVMPVRGWRFAPACCAAQSVFRRGPCFALPHHRLAWAALKLPRHS